MANIMSVMRNVSAPFGGADPNRPNISTTIWRTAVDHIGKIYYFESTLSPNIVRVRLDRLDFGKGKPVKKLKLVENFDLGGDVSGQFVKAKPFKFLGPK
jgi:choloylglycine hydrolase